MDGRGRGQAGEVDPADQWVYNPTTGSYELRLEPQIPGQHGSHTTPEQPYSPQPQVDRPYEPRLPSQRRHGAEPAGPPPDGPRRGRRRAARPGKSGKQKALIWTTGGLALLVLTVAVAGYLLYQQLNGNIDKVEVAGEDHAAVIDGPVNILVMGTDKRTGKGNEGYGDMNSPGHADTTLLFHVSEDRTNATALSIPRDMVTDIPSCKTKQDDGTWKTIPGTPDSRFNESLGQYGRDPGCTWKTVEKLTGLDVNHFLLADFNAVKDLSSAVGGVEVCLAEDIDDPKSHLQLPAGRHTVEGEQALAFVRTRYSVGLGSDLSRIELQQQFLGSLIRKMKSGDTLTSPKKLYDLAQTATKALTVDSGIGSAKELMALAKDLKQVPQKNITFATLPVLDNPDDPATVVMDEAKAGPLFRLLQADKPFGGEKKKEKPVKKADPSDVRVEVVNGGAEAGMALATADWLLSSQGIGYAAEAGNATKEYAKTRLEYGPAEAGQAAALREMMGLPKKALHKTGDDAGTGEDAMKLTLGKDFDAPGTPIEAPDQAPDGVQNVKANDKDICAK